ncbi:MAG: hypothetical protein IH795_07310, partial [Bacteroidetes bacterium]|nr:hypothetical protein [Bacteroidota bacterium]
MIEIEAKVWLTHLAIDQNSILELLKKEYKFTGEKDKYDWYFRKKGVKDIETNVRLRKLGKTESNNLFTVSHKNQIIIDGIESNEEI